MDKTESGPMHAKNRPSVHRRFRTEPAGSSLHETAARQMCSLNRLRTREQRSVIVHRCHSRYHAKPREKPPQPRQANDLVKHAISEEIADVKEQEKEVRGKNTQRAPTFPNSQLQSRTLATYFTLTLQSVTTRGAAWYHA